MPRVTLDNLDALAQAGRAERHAGYRAMLMVCAGTGCVSAKSLPDPRRDARGSSSAAGSRNEIQVVATGCNGFCAHGPICVVQPEGVFYERLKAAAVPELIESHFVRRASRSTKFLYRKDGEERPIPLEKDIEFFAKQQCIALRNRGKIDPEDIADAIRAGAYRALRKILARGRTATRSSRRSSARGSAAAAAAGSRPGSSGRPASRRLAKRGVAPYVVCNGDEGDPGAFMDRSIVEADPHAVIEGMLIGARALGATEGFVYIRHEYPLALERLTPRDRAGARVGRCSARDILGTGMEFDITDPPGAPARSCAASPPR